jgi:predicted AAA+ superfamily ATPase
MKRKIYQDLLIWKNSHDRKPLILQGARQVGKTYIVNLFGADNYANVVYCNFEKEPGLADFFTDLKPKNILEKLGNYKRKEILPSHTLIIFDEIQACPEALTSLKYFCEEANEYHLIATGSLLGVSVNRKESSFPVGKVEFLNMYPMDFEEFLYYNIRKLSI